MNAKVDYMFAAFCWALVLGPAILAAYHWEWPWLLLYLPVLAIFGGG